MFISLLVLAAPAYSRGDKCIPQVADGSDYHTRFDLVNISPQQSINGTFKLRFFHKDGTPWTLSFAAGSAQLTASEYLLTLAPRQNIRIETLGKSSPTTSGYAILEDDETKNFRDSDQALYSMDFVIGVSAYYVYYQGSSISDTVAVNPAEPTALGTFPVEVDVANRVSTGISIVDLSGAANNVQLDLYSSGTLVSSVTVPVLGNHQVVQFLNEPGMFPSLTNFRGIVEFKSTGPVALLTLLETDIASGPQFATIQPTDREALRRNTYMAIPEPFDVPGVMPIDLDRFVVDWTSLADEEGMSWDLKYVKDNTGRRLVPATENYAGLAVLGVLSNAQFGQLSLQDLKGLNYNSSGIDLSDGSTTLSQIQNPGANQAYVFAVKTDLGHYAKVWVFETVEDSAHTYLDLVVAAVVYR